MNTSDPAEASEPGNAPVPTEDRRSRWGCFIAGGLIGAGVVGFCVFDAWYSAGKRRSGNYRMTVYNGTSMVLALNDFASEYGSYPDRETAAAVMRNTHTTLDLDGDTANHYFRQLIAAGVVKSEDPFYAKTPYSPRKPDNNMKGPEALKPGEVGFGYLMNGNKALPNDDPNRIIAVTPLRNGSTSGEFDPKPLNGKAVLVYLDSGVKLITIREGDHQVMPSRGKTLLENGEDTLWGTAITPVIKPPQMPPGWMPAKVPTGQGTWLAIVGGILVLLAGGVMVNRRRSAKRCA